MSLPPRNIVCIELATIDVPVKIPADPPGVIKNPGGLGTRHVQIILMFLGFTISFMMRVDVSVAVVAMANSTTTNSDIPVYDWDSSTRAYVLSSFFWGYVMTQLPVGQIAHMWSASKLWAICMLACGVVDILIPVAARTGGWMAVCACRFIMGLCQASVFPCVHTLLGKWVPPNERGRLGTYSYAGAQFGTVIGLPVSGLLAASAAGWPSIFYLIGSLAIAWSVAFFILGADSPAQHRGIKPAERDYIEESLGQVHVKKQPPTPWKQILTSLPFWSLLIAHCGQNWGYWLLASQIPTYMSAILKFDISQNGLISALPYLAMMLLSFLISWTSDYILKRGWLTRGAARKISNSIGHWGPAVALIGLGYTTVDHTVIAVIVLVFAVGLNAGILSGYQINHIDLSPNFAGTLMSITNCVANVMSLLAPLIAGLIIDNKYDITQWRTVFFITTTVYFGCNLFFVLFGQAEVQPWNEPEVEQNAENGRTANSEENSDHNKSGKIQ